MEHSEYQSVIENISEQINQCKSVLSKCFALDILDKMAVEDASSSCRKALQSTDKFINNDLCPLIETTSLNDVQRSRIVELTKELLLYRTGLNIIFQGED